MVESQHVDDDAVMYGDDSVGGHVFLHDADMLDQPDLFYGAQGTQPCDVIIMINNLNNYSKTNFVVLSSRQSHCESSAGSFDE